MNYHFCFDIKTVSEANQREHWRTKHNRKKSQQKEFALLWRYSQPGAITVQDGATITFTRYSCRALDSDNLAGAFKHIRDQLAMELGIDDGSELIEWRYKQERIPKRENWFTVTIKSQDVTPMTESTMVN